jgi:WD40 repeat protein
VRSLAGHAQRVTVVAMRRDGSAFASASKDGVVRLWDVESEASLIALDAARGAVSNLAFTPDGTRLRTQHADGAILEWDLARYDACIEGNRAAQEGRRSSR